ncbi:peptidase [Stenomitos frigidus ULC18]|uniref:Peptidase n=1 Tax=Stenomitos frigidus ULC18 TaxID=2107698 RepID=A0A2T1E2X9_9CYAN|nr:peptidase [Stenomitos frigidus ULC18]
MERSRAKAIRSLPLLAVVFGVALAVVFHVLYEPTSRAQAAVVNQSYEETIAQKPAPDFPLRSHPLPPFLAKWRDPKQTGDYFDQIKVAPVGYLVWSQFPITIYLQPPTATELANSFTAQRSQVWLTAVKQAVQAWQSYLPLKLVSQAEGADIVMLRTPPPLQLEVEDVPAVNQSNPADQTVREQRPTIRLGRARSATTSYKIYAKGLSSDRGLSKPMLAHRFTIQLRPDQAPQYLQAAALHELGHALGLWGHSRSQTDVMYFSQVRQPPPISSRDLNTLKRIYEQPTRLGWELSE